MPHVPCRQYAAIRLLALTAAIVLVACASPTDPVHGIGCTVSRQDTMQLTGGGYVLVNLTGNYDDCTKLNQDSLRDSGWVITWNPALSR